MPTGTPADQIVTFLRDESPQTTALVIANLHATLAGLPETQQAEIARRIAEMGETPQEVVKQVEAVMRQKTAMAVREAMPDLGASSRWRPSSPALTTMPWSETTER